ncbi:MAG: NAD(P)/FAD-dependent oxidoreductase [Pseudomonadota bacterium]
MSDAAAEKPPLPRDDHQPDVDVIIIGAGLSGVGAAYHLQKALPGKSYEILEGRSAIGGTWDLFRYPGVRSDSDMFTLGYRFRPWRAAKAIADGPSILDYVNDTARDYGIDRKIRFDHRVVGLSWSSERALWTVDVDVNGARSSRTCRFVWNCAGYYRYASGYTPDFPGIDRFKGDVLHPQLWPENYDYAGKRIVVIGSGATAVTLVPSMAEKAAHVTMLQRSPTYMFAMPSTSALAAFLGRIMPAGAVYRIMRWQRIVFQQFMYKLARARPKMMRKRLIQQMQEKLGPDFDVEKHFSPAYNPWDQRICLVPDDDLFTSIRKGDASVVTDHIEEIVEDGIKLKSGDILNADLIITATGLALEALGGAEVRIDGARVQFGDRFTYKGLMFEGVPNMTSVFGYTNASWTLRADLVSDFTCRLLKHLDETGAASATPVNDDPSMEREPFLDFSSGYVTRAHDILPKQGRAPWRHPQDFFVDMARLRYGAIDDGILHFKKESVAAEGTHAERLAAE